MNVVAPRLNRTMRSVGSSTKLPWSVPPRVSLSFFAPRRRSDWANGRVSERNLRYPEKLHPKLNAHRFLEFASDVQGNVSFKQGISAPELIASGAPARGNSM